MGKSDPQWTPAPRPGPQSAPGPPPDSGVSRDLRRHSFRLIREVITGLGWKYKAFLPAHILISLTFLLPPFLLQFFTRGLTLGKSPSGLTGVVLPDGFLLKLILFGSVVAISMWIGIFLGSILSEWLRLTVSIGLRRQVLRSLHNTRIESLDLAHRGDWLTRMTSDLRNCEGFLSDSLPDQIRNATMMTGVAVIFFIESGPVALIPCIAAVFLGWFNVHVQRRMAPVLSEVRMLEGNIFQLMIESFEGIRTIRSYGGETTVSDKVNIGLKQLFSAGLHIIRRMGALMGLNELAGQVVITLSLTAAALALKRSPIEAADILVYPFFLNMFLSATKSLVASAYDWNRYFIEGGRLAAVFYDEENQLPDPSTLFGETTKIEDFRSLAIRDLEAGYGDESPVIAEHDFRIASGEIVAVMGPSGCGKSTFLEVVAGLRFARSGSFSLADGPDEFAWDQLPVFLSAYVEQHPYIFVGSFRENVTLGLGESVEPSDERIWEALEKVDLDDIVRERGGLDEILTDRGQNLSEGQRYRLALVRALLADRPILLLDEPFAALDPGSIRVVVNAMQLESAEGKAIVLVTHSLPDGLKDCRVERMKALRPTETGPSFEPGPSSGFGPGQMPDPAVPPPGRNDRQ